jgi:lysophospholipase L1-like esterase
MSLPLRAVLVAALVAALPASSLAVATASTTTTAKKKSKPHHVSAKPKLVSSSAAAQKPVRRIWHPRTWVSPALRLAALTEVGEQMTLRQPQFENAAALVPYFELLNQAQRTGQPVHILQFGDSHTASDDWVNAMRIALQTKYGSGGAGFMPTGRPYRGYRHYDVASWSSTGWVSEGAVNQLGDGREGLSGLSISTQLPGRGVTLTAACDRLELFFLRQPGGGQVEFSVDSQPVDTISTDGDPGPGSYVYTPQPGSHEYELRTVSRDPVRLLGWAADNRHGVTWETLGINGAQASILLGWDETIFSAQLAERDPALVVLAYGTNEANSRAFDPGEYRAILRSVIARIRKASPVASILMVGPPDCGARKPLAHLDEVISVQREVAGEMAVAFWDWRQHMGGPGATYLWVRAGLGQGDHIHLTGDGYRLLGKALLDELEMEYAIYKSVQAPASQVSTTSSSNQPVTPSPSLPK